MPPKPQLHPPLAAAADGGGASILHQLGDLAPCLPQPPPRLGDWVDSLQPAKRLQPHLGFELRRMNSGLF